MIRRALRWLSKPALGRPEDVGYQPLQLEVHTVRGGCAILVTLDSDKELILLLPKASGLKLIDAMLDKLGIEAEDDVAPAG